MFNPLISLSPDLLIPLSVCPLNSAFRTPHFEFPTKAFSPSPYLSIIFFAFNSAFRDPHSAFLISLLSKKLPHLQEGWG
jgi:hypothetical protein